MMITNLTAARVERDYRVDRYTAEATARRQRSQARTAAAADRRPGVHPIAALRRRVGHGGGQTVVGGLTPAGGTPVR